MIIDIHAHYVSPLLIAEAKRNGARYGVSVATSPDGSERVTFGDTGETLRPFFTELCSLPARASYLAALGIDQQVVSTWTDMSGDHLTGKPARNWARLQNETIVEDCRASNGRFEAMGTLPLQDIAASLDELDHLAKGLGVRSLELVTSVNGQDLDHDDLRPLWRRIADYDLLVLLHPPFKPVGLERTGDYFLNNLISYPTDTTIAAARILFSGMLRDMPGLKLCLAHGGGFLPYQIGRFDRGFAAHPACKQAIDKEPHEFLASFFYDTLTHDTGALNYLNTTVGSERLLYGSDYPFEMLDESGPQRVRNIDASADAIDDILGLNAQSLLRSPLPASVRQVEAAKA